MPRLILGPVLRHVDARRATIWVETDVPCTVQVLAPPGGGARRTFTVAGHHYALVVVDGLTPATTVPYQVLLDGEPSWPCSGALPPSCIRTAPHPRPILAFGSCRAAAPHVPPYTLEPQHDRRGKGVDALRGLGERMAASTPEDWPHLLLLLGDQVYADEVSPATEARLRQVRGGPGTPPRRLVGGFEQYTWLYHEAWSPDVERWLLSVVPSVMIFDDHEVVDDWNISAAWRARIARRPWWREHIDGALASYWIYQHLGNMTPEEIDADGLLDELSQAQDGLAALCRWARAAEAPGSEEQRFSLSRRLGDVQVVVADCRQARDLDPAHRDMLDATEWDWVEQECARPARHLVLATSIPVLVPGGMHGVQQWSEVRCASPHRTARAVSEWLRTYLDLEDWPAFDRSFRRFERMLVRRCAAVDAPATLTLLSGDIHCAYVADVHLPAATPTMVRQVVCSPLRNVLRRRERRVMGFAAGRVGRAIGARLARRAGRSSSTLRWETVEGPFFQNNVGWMRFDGDAVELTLALAEPAEDGRAGLRAVVSRRDAPNAAPPAYGSPLPAS